MRDDIEESLDAPVGRDRIPFGQLISAWAGTAVVVTVTAGLAWWAWDLMNRDAGAVPIVVAAGGPAKERPEGGPAPVPNSDIESYALATEASLVLDGGLAPETDAPQDEDLALGALATMAATLPRAREEAAEVEQPAVEPEPEIAAIDPAAVADALPEGPVPPADEGSDLAPAQTPVAPARPSDLPARVATARREVAAEPAALAKRAAASPFQLQLGAYLSEDLTRAEWARISRSHAELLNNRALAIQTTLSGGKTYYRLRVGPFDGLAEAASVCEALRARGQDCIPAGNQ